MRTATTTARTSLPPWYSQRWACVAWLLVMQFPLPMAHSHSHLSQVNPQACQEHLQLYHASQDSPAASLLALGPDQLDSHDELHWHWVLPCELIPLHTANTCQTDNSCAHSPGGILWSANGQVHALQTNASSCQDLFQSDRHLPAWNQTVTEASDSSTAVRTSSGRSDVLDSAFVHKFSGIPMRKWIAVYLM